MKSLALITVYIMFTVFCFAQNESSMEITPQVLQKITADVEKLIPAYKKTLAARALNADETAFSVDTFRISKIFSRRMDIDYSTVGMNTTVFEMTGSYDKLMNRYYNRLLKALNPQDKFQLINAQKAWLAFRDAEVKLIRTMAKDVYSGGGTIQSTIAAGILSDLVVKRTIEIFNYCNAIEK